MGVYLYNPCLPNLRTTGIPYATCGAPMGLKFTEEEFQQVLPSLMAFRDSSTIEVDYVFNQAADGPGSYSPPSRYTVNTDFSGQASRDDSHPTIAYSVLQEDGTYKTYAHAPGTNPLTTNFCDAFPPLKWSAGGVTRTDCVESPGEVCDGYYNWTCVGYDWGSMCWHPFIHNSKEVMVKYWVPCDHFWGSGLNEFRDGYLCWVLLPLDKKTNQSCCYTHTAGKIVPNSNSGYSQINIAWGGISKTPEGDYVVFTPSVSTSYKVPNYYYTFDGGHNSWGSGCLCTPLEIGHLLGQIRPLIDASFRASSICVKDGGYNVYNSCGGRNYMQGGAGYFPVGPVENTDPANGVVTPYFHRGNGHFDQARGGPWNYNKPNPPGNGAYYEVIPNSNASWRFSGGCWEFGFSNYESESCGGQSFSVFIRLCPGNVVNYDPPSGCRNF